MSNYQAIATATATLADIVRDALRIVPGAEVRIGRPESAKPFLGANLYLYRIAPSAAFRNEDLATRADDGTLLQRPRAAIDLYYLISFYGEKKQSDLDPQLMMGSTVSALHAFPVLTREQIRKTIAAYPELSGADLDEQVESVKFTMVSLNLEELSKLWTVFFQTTHTLSVAYEGTVILIDAAVSPQKALPVRQPAATIAPQSLPRLERVSPSIVAYREGVEVVLSGSNLVRDGVLVRFGDLTVTPRPGSNRTTLIVSLPKGLLPGVNQAQVVSSSGAPGPSSNACSFVLQPRIEAVRLHRGRDARDRLLESRRQMLTIQLRMAPEPGPHQRLVLWLNETAPAGSSTRGYGLESALRFDVDERYGSELDADVVSPGLRESFHAHSITLSQQISVDVRAPDTVWMLRDREKQQVYSIRKSGQRLVVYFGVPDDDANDWIAFEIQLPGQFLRKHSTLAVEPGTYLVRLQVDGVPYAESQLVWDSELGAYVGPTVTVK